MPPSIVDSHVHFWDPAELSYPWLDGLPSLRRAFLPRDYVTATEQLPIDRLVFVEANARPEQAGREVEFVLRLAREDRRVAGIVAFVDVSQGPGVGGSGLGEALDVLSRVPLVKGIRQNIQGHPPGWCIPRAFVDGVREAARRGPASG